MKFVLKQELPIYNENYQNILFKSKLFALITLLIGLFTLIAIGIQIATYSKYIKPNLEWMYKVYTHNNISGVNMLAYFTVQSNILASIYMILISSKILIFKKNRFLKNIVENGYIKSALCLFCGITGILYFSILIWFTKFYKLGGMYTFYNISNFTYHLVIPLYFIILIFFPNTAKPINFKRAIFIMLYPFLYFAFSLIRGKFGSAKWYPYPFLVPEQFWSYASVEKYPGKWGIVFWVVGMATLATFISIILYAVVKINNRRLEIKKPKTLAE